MRSAVRTSSIDATPYLREKLPAMKDRINKMHKTDPMAVIVDLGAGNGRNSKYLYQNLTQVKKYQVHSFDAVADHKGVKQADLEAVGHCPSALDLEYGKASLVLCQYVFMFIKPAKHRSVVNLIDNLTADGGFVVCELFENLTEGTHYEGVQENIIKLFTGGQRGPSLGWRVFHERKDHFILEKTK